MAELPAHYNESNIIYSQVNASQSSFKWLSYISTNRHLRSVANKLPFPGLIQYIRKIIYKENQTNLKGISTDKSIADSNKYELLASEKTIDSEFPPVYKNAFFNGERHCTLIINLPEPQILRLDCVWIFSAGLSC